MKKTDFNRDWTVRPLSREGEAISVTLPHDAMRTENRVGTSIGEGNIGWYEGGDYEYRKVFRIPQELRGKKLLLEFESVYHNAEVYINGKKAAYRPYGYTNFYVEMNPFLNMEEDNEIIVIARNADQPNSRWYSGTGIFRPVWLWSAGEEHILIRAIPAGKYLFQMVLRNRYFPAGMALVSRGGAHSDQWRQNRNREYFSGSA